MAITPAMLIARQGYLGASDFPAILGLDPFRDALSVWQDKMGVPRADEGGDDRKARAGLRREKYLREVLKEELEQAGSLCEVIEPTVTFHHPTHDFIAANPDALVIHRSGPQELCELKLSGVMDEWGDDLSGDVPARVLTQVLVQQACRPDCPRTHIVREFPDRHDWVAHRHVIERRDDLTATIIEAGVIFWQKYVLTKTAPDPDQYPPMLESARRMVRDEGTETEVVFATDIKPWQEARQKRLDAEKDEEAALARLLVRMGDARTGVCQEGRFVYAKESAGQRVNVEALKAQYPAVYLDVAKAATRNVPRWKGVRQ